MNSILQTEKECYVTGSTLGLNKHHIYFAANRNISEQNGFWVWLRADYHNQNSRIDVHHNREFDLKLKRECQEKYEETESRENFIKLIGKSYL